jgi:predicted small lipoprotein YifL
MIGSNPSGRPGREKKADDTMRSSLFRAVIVAMLAGGLASACGKRGQLEPPPGAAQANTPANSAETTSGREGLGNRRQPITPPKRSLPIDFILD